MAGFVAEQGRVHIERAAGNDQGVDGIEIAFGDIGFVGQQPLAPDSAVPSVPLALVNTFTPIVL